MIKIFNNLLEIHILEDIHNHFILVNIQMMFFILIKILCTPQL